MSLAGLEVVVVGGGIGGLAAALALARRGAQVSVFEQAPALGEVGAGLQVGPNGVAVLAALGLAQTAVAAASVPEAVELRDHRNGRLIVRLPLGAAFAARYGRPYLQFHRADLLALLADAAAGAGVGVVTGRRVESVAASGVGVRIETDSGGHEAAVAVAADGLRSAVRAAHLAGRPPRFTGHVAWRALVPADRVEAPPGATQVTLAPGRHTVSYPLRSGQLVNLVAIEERSAWQPEGWSITDDPANLRRAFAGWSGPSGALLAAVDQCFLWGLFDHPPLAAWTAGRIALLGDACHPMLPFLAQGATMALEDAWVLADALDRARTPEAGLAAYAARRIARATRVQRSAAGAGRLYHLRPGLAGAAHLGLRLAGPLGRALLTRRFDWLYGRDVTQQR
ncbi:MAG: FAD-dependent monooxygenase [Amaricoccus sp.]